MMLKHPLATIIKFLGVITMFVIIGCGEEISKFIFDASKMSRQTKYEWVSKNGRHISQTEKSYTIMFGNMVDSMISVTRYEHNNEGLLQKETTLTLPNKKPTVRLYIYNANDSLTTMLTVNEDGDTTFCEKYQYYLDGRKIVYHRELLPRFEPGEDLTQLITNKRFDTVLYKNLYEYNKGLCTVQSQYDKLDQLQKRIIFDYKGGRLIKETHKRLNRSVWMLEKVKHWNYNKSSIKPDYYSLSSESDTIEQSINEFKDGTLVTTTETFDYGNLLNKLFYENGKLIGTLAEDRKGKFRMFDSYSYYKNGDMAEWSAYSEEIPDN